MGIFSLFGKKNNDRDKRSKNIDEAFSKVYSQMGQIDSWDDPKKLEKYILDSCEQIVATTKEIEKQKTEYKIITSYLNDVKIFDSLPDARATELRNTAARILEIEQAIDNAKDVHRNITEDQIIVIAGEEDQMPDIINRMTESEKILYAVKKEMNQLEGEKSRWEIERESVIDQKQLIRKLATVLFVAFTALLILIYITVFSTKADVTTMLLVILVAATAFGLGIFLKQNDLKRKGNKTVFHLNQIISSLNVVRMKYVNIASGLEYSKEKYQVNSASELAYVWEQYMETIRDQERFTKHNEDLEVYTKRLGRILASLNLHDAKIWSTQIKALVDADAMYEVRQRLVGRRSKIRDRIDENTKRVQSERNEIDRLMKTHQHYLPEIQEIIKSVDKLCGTSPQPVK
ncbi:MAG: hypothetical protein HUJ71_06260 [Pseudobutyrivibrio sp.]|nr:hypothetical protein [Pseudobutyrivibrio sp.]